MKKQHDPQQTLADLEEDIRQIWQAAPTHQGPSADTLARVHQLIRQAAQSAGPPSTQQRPRMLILGWRPVLAAAAVLLLLLGIARFWNPAPRQIPPQRELANFEQEIIKELDDLEIIIWDALAELEHDARTNDSLLQALAMQIVTWEDF
ncbi:MAG: hypothetical protein ACNA71_05725 [Kiritimatiellia bacterium]